MTAKRAVEYRGVRPVVPPVRVLVWPMRIWPPTRVRFGADTPLWQRALGVQLSKVLPGELIEMAVTQAGDLLCRITFDIEIDRERRKESMLLPTTDLWEPATVEDAQRLRTLATELDIRW
ncbi:hypothetical protein ACQP2U_42940 (plasmid) [Nocardia sp. CA-084685]|uniref:hypothetical protein n=1 Tax=Nocardia sp. CA-084685 TaxID=3239970 RepID=UPI003D9871ED